MHAYYFLNKMSMIKRTLKSDFLTLQQGVEISENERRLKNTIRSQTTNDGNGNGYDISCRQNSENPSNDCDDAATCIVDLEKVKKQFMIWNKAFQGMSCTISSHIKNAFLFK